MQHLPVWQLAASHIEVLKHAKGALPQVLNYNDFQWSNLALSRDGEPLRAVIYDSGLFGVGPRYSDYRNVVGSLADAARSAFWRQDRPVDEREAILDEPISELYALLVASSRTAFLTGRGQYCEGLRRAS